MSNTNEVTMTCPICQHDGRATAITYTPMAIMGSGSTYTDADGNELSSKGEVKCEHCSSRFLYKLVPVVTCVVAKMPVYE